MLLRTRLGVRSPQAGAYLLWLRAASSALLLVLSTARPLRARYLRHGELCNAAYFLISAALLALYELYVRRKYGLWGAGQILHGPWTLRAIFVTTLMVRAPTRALCIGQSWLVCLGASALPALSDASALPAAASTWHGCSVRYAKVPTALLCTVRHCAMTTAAASCMQAHAGLPLRARYAVPVHCVTGILLPVLGSPPSWPLAARGRNTLNSSAVPLTTPLRTLYLFLCPHSGFLRMFPSYPLRPPTPGPLYYAQPLLRAAICHCPDSAPPQALPQRPNRRARAAPPLPQPLLECFQSIRSTATVGCSCCTSPAASCSAWPASCATAASAASAAWCGARRPGSFQIQSTDPVRAACACIPLINVWHAFNAGVGMHKHGQATLSRPVAAHTYSRPDACHCASLTFALCYRPRAAGEKPATSAGCPQGRALGHFRPRHFPLRCSRCGGGPLAGAASLSPQRFNRFSWLSPPLLPLPLGASCRVLPHLPLAPT